MKNFFNKYNTYQKERFPLGIYSILILTLVLAAGTIAQNYVFSIEAFLMALSIFMLLRIADEFKDYEDDCKYRPYRAVPRGLITLKELGWLGFVIVLFAIVLAYFTQTLFTFTALLLYYAFMSKEFFMPIWLKKHPVIYLLSHMMIMPLIALLVVAIQSHFFDLPNNTTNFMFVAFFNGLVLEIGRKIRQKDEEEDGVETYSSLWGKVKALRIWQVTLFLSLFSLAAIVTHWFLFLAILALFFYFFYFAREFTISQTLKAKKIETLSGVWLLLTYLSIFIDGVI